MTEKEERDLIERICCDLQKNGFPLEIEAMKLLMRFDWRVIPQRALKLKDYLLIYFL